MLLGLAMLAAVAGAPEPSGAATVAQHAEGLNVTRTTRKITVEDYPHAARAKGEQGRAIVRFVVDETGTTRDCEIAATSRSAALDARTCEIAMRTRFRPAQDVQGRPVAEHWRWAIDWRSFEPGDIRIYDPFPEGTAPTYPEASEAPPVVFGTANWDAMPGFRLRGTLRSDARRLNDTVSSIFASKKCTIGAASADNYRLEVRYALRLTPDGRIERILVEDKGCRPLELLVASMALEEDFVRAVEPPGDAQSRWYKAAVEFNSQTCRSDLSRPNPSGSQRCARSISFR